MKILVVEDDENSRVLLTSVLSASGYSVENAGNGIEAIALLEAGLPDLIISDILMPQMDGYALCKRLKADGRFYKIPFVFYTATYTDPQDRKFALDIGASEFWVKPMEMELLLSELKKLEQSICRAGDREKLLSQTEASALDFDYKKILTKKLDKKVRDLHIERQKLQASENRYKRIVEALRDKYFFYTHDAQGVFTYVSPSMSVILGYSEAEFLVHYATYMTVSPVNNHAHNCKQRILEGNRHPAYEIELMHRNGNSRRFEITEEPVFDEQGAVVSIEGIAHDITEEREIETRIRKIHKMEALGTLAGGIAHDFNNILFSIMANANMIARRVEKDSEIDRFSNMILKAGQRAEGLTSQILTYLRQSSEEKQTVHIQGIIDEVFNLIRPAISKQITFDLDIDETCRPVFADPSQIHRVVMNLCTNAAQAIGDNVGNIGVSLKEVRIDQEDFETAPGTYLQMTVSDTGKGISANHIEKIFDPYFTTKEKGEGTGLGLSMVHGIVAGLDGYLTVKSEESKGAQFFVYFPL